MIPSYNINTRMRSNYEQGLQESQEPNIICTTLTPQEVEIALSYLKRRFSNYPLELVVSTLDHYIHQKPSFFARRHNTQHITEPSFKRNKPKTTEAQGNEAIINPSAKDEKRKKTQQTLKVVGALFCQQGYDYHKANRLLPQINQSSYRNALICIVNSVFNELLFCLKEQAQIQLQVTPFQKSLIRQQLLYAHRWMGLKSVSALTTFFKLIEKKFQKIKVRISDEQLKQLYSIIAQRITDKNVNLSQIEAPVPIFGKQGGQVQTLVNQSEVLLSQQHLMLVAKYFIKQKSTEKTVEALQKQNKKWHCKQVQRAIHLIIKKSIRKVVDNIIKIEVALRQIIQSDFDDNIDQKIMRKGENHLKIQLIKYYTVKKPKREQSEHIVSLVYAFIRGQGNNQSSNIDHPEIQYEMDFGVTDQEWNQAKEGKELPTHNQDGNLEEDEDIQWLIE